MEVVYQKENNSIKNLNKENYIGIDIGVNNLVAITSNKTNLYPVIINGRQLKSINQYYNKCLSKLKSLHKENKYYTSIKSRKLCLWRNNKINDYMHKVSKIIINYCIQNNIGNIVIGHNNLWKQNCNMNKSNNQNFVQIPFNFLINFIKYKAEEFNIKIYIVNEAYTSKCSFLDNEQICHHDIYLGKRIKRGLFQSKCKQLINADINGSLNILKQICKSFNISNKIFNPIKIKNLNAKSDIQKVFLNQLNSVNVSLITNLKLVSE